MGFQCGEPVTKVLEKLTEPSGDSEATWRAKGTKGGGSVPRGQITPPCWNQKGGAAGTIEVTQLLTDMPPEAKRKEGEMP